MVKSRLELRDYMLLIGIDRPEKRYGFTPKMFEELTAACTRLEHSADLRCGVLYADGDHFTAGLDLPTFAPLRQQGKPSIPPALVDLVASIESSDTLKDTPALSRRMLASIWRMLVQPVRARVISSF